MKRTVQAVHPSIEMRLFNAWKVNHHMPAAIRELMMTAQREVAHHQRVHHSRPPAIERMRDLHARGVKVRILTISLASHDVLAVNSHYKAWRKPILQSGAERYEVRPDAAVKPSIADTPPTRAVIADG